MEAAHREAKVGKGQIEMATSSFVGSGTKGLRCRRGGHRGDRGNKLSIQTGEGV